MKLRQYLRICRFSVRAFAKIAGVNASTISRVARGQGASLPSAVKIEKATKGYVKVTELSAKRKRKQKP